MHENRVTDRQLYDLVNGNLDQSETRRIMKNLKLMCIDYPVMAEQMKLLESKFEIAQSKAGKYDQIVNNLKIE